MKMRSSFTCLLLSLLFIGCFEVEEKTTFKTAETGDYMVTVDMSKMLSQVKMLGGADKLKDFAVKDTTVSLKDLVAGDTALTADEKNTIANGYMQMQVNEDKAEMKMILSAPFTSVERIGAIRNALFNLVVSKSKMPVPGVQNPLGDGSLSLFDLSSLGLEFKATKGSISTKITDSVGLKNKVDTSAMLQQVRQMAPLMGGPVVYKSIFSFATPVKNMVAAKGTISDDRKTIIIKNELDDLFENPASFEYSISY